jgi:ubiquinone/menaquinone biosynthesis C-methylase UbiE
MSYETRFAGAIPELYERHLGPVLFEPYAKDLAARLPPTAVRVLEAAAGTGRVTRKLLAHLPPEGVLVATDLNEAMLDEGKRRLADPRLSWQVADMQELALPDASFNAVVCQFGLMFVPDKPRALRELRRVLAPGGILLLSTWDSLDRNPATKLLHELAAQTFPGDPPQFMKVPFSMPDPGALLQLAADAGFDGVRVDTVAITGEAESAAHLATGFARGNPLWHELSQREVDAAAFEADVAKRLAHAFGDRPCKTPMSAHVLTGWAQ